MTINEIHKLLDDLPWEDVEAVAEADSSIKKHLDSCKICRERERKVTDGRLAAMGAPKRQLILKGAERLASLFKEDHKA